MNANLKKRWWLMYFLGVGFIFYPFFFNENISDRWVYFGAFLLIIYLVRRICFDYSIRNFPKMELFNLFGAIFVILALRIKSPLFGFIGLGFLALYWPIKLWYFIKAKIKAKAKLVEEKKQKEKDWSLEEVC